jgi:predicted helicase
MSVPLTFNKLLADFRETAASERDKGDRFERLIKNYLLTDPIYETVIEDVWLWEEFPFRDQFGGRDIGIDLVTKNQNGDLWAVQCKCYQADAYIDKSSVDSFLSTSGRSFKNFAGETVKFADRLWISTTNNWSANAEETLKNQDPPVSRINLTNLIEASVDWEKIASGVFGKQARSVQKTLRLHQTAALNATITDFKTADRGKLIMACGTGKTFTSLKIAESQAPADGLVLFLVPSIALLGQTLREWTAESERPIQAICICSDAKVSRQKVETTDNGDASVVDLAVPASTNVKTIIRQLKSRHDRTNQLTVVFSTYQSIEVIADAQRAYATEYGEDIFDLIICDEAHRTTGVTVADTDESAFVKVHDNEFIKARKRLYMTATPRLFDDNSKAKAALNDAELCSMDDPELYGEEFYRIGFGEAVEKGLLSDYKVLILTLKERFFLQICGKRRFALFQSSFFYKPTYFCFCEL